MARRGVRSGLGWVPGLIILGSREAVAGMPSITVTDLTWLRIEAISFFGMLFLLAAWGVRAIWNGLRGDFPWLPRLSFGRALGLMAIWGLLFLLVLTMISGARELMTPGAWKKVGLTFKLADEAKNQEATPVDPTMAARQVSLARLKALLWQYASAHDGRFPATRAEAGFPDEVWLAPGSAPMHYAYVGGLRLDPGSIAALVFEPDLFGPDRMVLMANGETIHLNRAATPPAQPPGSRQP